MKKLLLLSAVALLATSANATDIKPYVEGRISHNWLKANYKEDGYGKEKFKDNVFGGSVEVGGKIQQFRAGLEAYYNDDIEDKFYGLSVKGKSKGLFLNAYYDIPMCEKLKQIKPYVGGGIGYSWLKEELDASILGLGKMTAKDKDWGWNVGVGLGYQITENVDLTLGYRYEDLGKIKETDNKTDFTNHKVSFGVRYTF